MEIVKKTVLFFDICSSSSIIEDLHRNDNEIKWKRIILSISRFLNSNKEDFFEIYKFLGDGWILIFDYRINPEKVFTFLDELCERYHKLYTTHIEGILDSPIDPKGITFGIDRGNLIQIQLNGETEYLGRSLNIAARLQSSIKDKDKNPQYKLLMPNHLYSSISEFLRKTYKVQRARRTLRNISEKELEYKKIILR